MKKTMLCVICGCVVGLSGFAQPTAPEQINQTNQQNNPQVTDPKQKLIDEINQMSPKDLIMFNQCLKIYKMRDHSNNSQNPQNEYFWDLGFKDGEDWLYGRGDTRENIGVMIKAKGNEMLRWGPIYSEYCFEEYSAGLWKGSEGRWSW